MPVPSTLPCGRPWLNCAPRRPSFTPEWHPLGPVQVMSSLLCQRAFRRKRRPARAPLHWRRSYRRAPLCDRAFPQPRPARLPRLPDVDDVMTFLSGLDVLLDQHLQTAMLNVVCVHVFLRYPTARRHAEAAAGRTAANRAGWLISLKRQIPTQSGTRAWRLIMRTPSRPRRRKRALRGRPGGA